MTDQQYRDRVLHVERFCNSRVDLLRSAPSRAQARAGESGILADVAASMQMEQRNAAQIALTEELLHFLSECVDADFYGLERPLDERFAAELAHFDAQWSPQS